MASTITSLFIGLTGFCHHLWFVTLSFCTSSKFSMRLLNFQHSIVYLTSVSAGGIISFKTSWWQIPLQFSWACTLLTKWESADTTGLAVLAKSPSGTGMSLNATDVLDSYFSSKQCWRCFSLTVSSLWTRFWFLQCTSSQFADYLCGSRSAQLPIESATKILRLLALRHVKLTLLNLASDGSQLPSFVQKCLFLTSTVWIRVIWLTILLLFTFGYPGSVVYSSALPFGHIWGSCLVIQLSTLVMFLLGA